MFTSASAFSLLRYASLLMIALTIGLLSWHRYGMNKTFSLDPRNGFQYSAQADNEAGGTSTAKIEQEKNGMLLSCEIASKYQWPFCQAAVALAEPPKGVDLTGYDSVFFDLSYSGPGPHTIRLYLRNFEPEISNLKETASLKVNELEFDVPESGKMTIPTTLFRVASWWASERKTPLMHTDMRIDNVSTVEISTGSFVQAGHHEIEIRSIQFLGKWMSQMQLVMALGGAWFMFGFVWLAVSLQYFRTGYLASREREVHLQSINAALKLETRELAGQARTDPLTGALNREGLREFLMTQWRGRIPDDPPVAVLFADLDHFKSINDEHGHAVGDDVLRKFAQLVQHEIRSNDRFVRWGGEEFLILCEDTRDDQGRRLAEKLRTALSRHDWPNGLKVTASFGVTKHIANEDFGDMLLRADRALYAAKEGGRDRVEVL
ncbi:MAG TPA: GGDEF domain-containing protein [Burkholderiaceae bacterium]|jgi:diguanylate cyclase (GGDEF)-like protein